MARGGGIITFFFFNKLFRIKDGQRKGGGSSRRGNCRQQTFPGDIDTHAKAWCASSGDIRSHTHTNSTAEVSEGRTAMGC